MNSQTRLLNLLNFQVYSNRRALAPALQSQPENETPVPVRAGAGAALFSGYCILGSLEY